MGILEEKEDADMLNCKGNLNKIISKNLNGKNSGRNVAVPFSSPSARGIPTGSSKIHSLFSLYRTLDSK